MKKFIFVLPILLTLPSYADIASGANNATCNSDTIGATEGSTDLEAQWSANQYSENPGYYLLYANNTVSTNQTCTAGNYCPGFTNQTFADATMGLNSCASNDANFPNSAAGASAATDCYRACNISNMGTESGKTIAPIAHATAISGNDYYGAGTDTCVPTACDQGYHVGGGVGPLASYVGTNASSKRYKSLNGTGTNSSNTTGLNNGEWDVTWSDGTVVKGTSACVTTAGTNPWDTDDYELFAANVHASGDFTAGDYGDNASGKQYCYCRTDSYTLPSSATQSVASPSWVFDYDADSASSCVNDCANFCADNVQYDSGLRSALFGSLGANSPVVCEANTIDIIWYKNNGEANVENQCTYGGAVTIPEQPTKTGYTFGGWRIKTSNN